MASAESPLWQGDMGRTWARLNAATDRQLAEVGDVLLGSLAARPGERILDLGCGGGTTTLAIAAAVGPEGRVTGVDISPDLVALARSRAAALETVSILEADAATHGFAPAEYDALLSRHGCMFFADPPAAFANIRTGLRPGARVVLTAFGPFADNPWACVPLAAAEAVLGPGAPPDASQPGPFAWAEPAAFERALSAAGFGAVGWEPRDVTFTLGAGEDPDPVERACDMTLSVGMLARRVRTEGGDAAARLRPVLAEALRPHVRDGWVRLGARTWLVSARA